MTLFICNFCAKEFVGVPSKHPKFCSRKCHGLASRKTITKNCVRCNSIYKIVKSADKGISRSKYCSIDCRRKSVGESFKKTKKTICKNCGNFFDQIPSSNKIFCNKDCYNSFMSSNKIFIKLGEKRNYISKRKNRKKCFKCGETKILHIHHMDGNQMNDKENNLICLCSKCHSLLHTLYRESQKSFLNFSLCFLRKRKRSH